MATVTKTKKKKLPYGPINVEALQQVKQKILAEPRAFDMWDWGFFYTKKEWNATCEFEYFDTPRSEKDFPPCGTVACIAGWVSALEYLKTHKTLMKWEFNFTEVSEILGIDDKTAEKIFFDWCWPEKFKKPYKKALGSLQKRAEVTAKYIDWICGV